MEFKRENFDIAVIGGGPAGMIAAGRAAELGAKVVLIERNERLGKKLLLTGKGRCNITHAEFDNREFLKAYGKNGKFLFPGFSVFGPQETVKFFEDRGLRTKVEQGKRIFPDKGTAFNVLHCLIDYLKQGKVVIKKYSRIIDVKVVDNRIQSIVTDNKEHMSAKNFILATGGKTFPETGSTGDGFNLAKKLGHKIISLRPAISPIKIKESWPKKLSGLALKNVKISVFQNEKKILEEIGEFLFTHFGISGPIVMDASKTIDQLAGQGKVKIILDLKPGLDSKALNERIQKDFDKNPQKIFSNSLDDLLPKSIIETAIKFSGIDADKKVSNISKIEREKLAKTLKNMEMTFDGLLGFEHAIITAGGIDLKEIDSRTMRSKLISNLYFAGEILDLDGPTGGYNLQICWTTGYIAGNSAGRG